MKLNKWLFGAAALALMASCSDKDVAPDSPSNVPGSDGGVSTSSGYLAVQINLPQQSTTRAYDGSNDKYDDGEAWEYNVSNALIVLFTGKHNTEVATANNIYLPDNENDIKFLRAQELTKPFFWNEDANDNITTSYLAAIEVVNKNFADGLWAIVMLNRDTQKFKYEKDENKLTINGAEIKTYADLLNSVSTQDDDSEFLITDPESGEKRIFMTNAPLSNVKGGKTGSADELETPYIETLSYLGTKDQLWDSMEEAKTHPAACIFVERALAKVSYGKTANDAIQLKFIKRQQLMDGDTPVVDSDGNPVYEDVEMGANEITSDIDWVQYCLTNKNKKSYVIRNVNFEGISNSHFDWALTYYSDALKTDYRMVGDEGMPALKSPFHQEKKSLYRTYWCKDPNYAVKMEDNVDNTSYSEADFVYAENGTNNMSLYSKENTFTVQYQTHGNTTLAIFKVNFNIAKNTQGAVGTENGNLYIRDDNKEKIYLTAEEAMAPVFLRVYNDNDIKTALKSLAKSGVTGTYKVSDYIKIGWEVSSTDKKVKWTDIYLEVKEGDKFFPTKVEVENADGTKSEVSVAEAFTRLIGANNKDSKPMIKYNLLSDLNNWYDVTEYTGGVSYYTVPIKHFGDYYCPWDGTGTKTEETYNYTTDNDHANKWLGRYGMVRNNWYELNITKIKALGSAVPPEIEDDLSDDFKEEKKYFAVEIHTLSWAKRTQDITFQ